MELAEAADGDAGVCSVQEEERVGDAEAAMASGGLHHAGRISAVAAEACRDAVIILTTPLILHRFIQGKLPLLQTMNWAI